MKIYFIKWYAALFIGIWCCPNIDMQAQDQRPAEPILQRVTVDPETGVVTINWDPGTQSTPVTTDGFVINWLQKSTSSNFAIDTIWDPNVRSYQFDPDTMPSSMPDPRKTTVPFTINAVHKKPFSISTRTQEDYNIQVTSKYDSCRAEIKLNWYPYRGWSNNVYTWSYHIMRIINTGGSSTVETVKTLAEQDTSYTVLRVAENEQYTFYIEAERNDGLKSTSYKTEWFTKMPIPPTFVQADGTYYDAQERAHITFKIDPASQTHIYELLGSSRPDYAFVSQGTYTIMGSDTVLSDTKRGRTFYYKLAAWHICKNRYTAESNIATALWLSLKQEGQLNTLQWDAYRDWTTPVIYDVHRRIGAKDSVLISGGTTGYVDDLSGIKIDDDICYWIVARPTTPTSADQQAISNSVCIQPESDIWIPQAFTPNGDGNNDVYKPFFSYLPQDYLFIIYDRTGAKVFETKNVDEAWDGRLKNGHPANEGVYVYYIKYQTARGRLVEKKGTLTLVLP